jgi:hypothetical protein
MAVLEAIAQVGRGTRRQTRQACGAPSSTADGWFYSVEASGFIIALSCESSQAIGVKVFAPLRRGKSSRPESGYGLACVGVSPVIQQVNGRNHSTGTSEPRR